MVHRPYTEGPWEARKRSDSGFDICVVGAPKSAGCIARVPGVETKPVVANAALIAAAPSLAEALRHLVDTIARSDEEPVTAKEWFEAQERARAVLGTIDPRLLP